MRKTIIIIAIFSAVALIATGCAVKNAPDRKNSNALGQNNEGVSTTMKINFGTPASIQDLKIGKKITVMGTSNADGTVSATNIIIGEMPGFGLGMRSSTQYFATGTMPKQEDDNQQNFQQPPQGEQFQRRSTDGQWNGPNGSGQQRTARMSGQARITGEIMKMDETSLVLQIADNGSKIVFYSEKTEIFNAPTSTPPFHPQISTSTASGSQE